MSGVFEMFEYAFMTRALIAGVFVSLSAALIGVPLVLRKNAMIGDGLSHVAFSAFAIATVAGIAPLPFAIPVVIIGSFLLLWIEKSRKVYGDAAVAVLSASSLAIGTIVVSVSKGVNIDLNSYLFGSVLAIGGTEVVLSAVLCAVVVGVYLVFYNRIFSLTFDEEFSKSIGVKTELFQVLFSVVCSVVIVLGMRLVGALLVSSLIIFPTLIATSLAKSFRGVIKTAAAVTVLNFVVGLSLSFLFATPTGATIVAVNLVGFLITRFGELRPGLS
ncbi:metal ABC transporter permease [Candidatus Saccharibacteria bacterium]|nr:metal ABC transporter permease [Candidatus Saccharibacteria bacterium]